MRSLGLGLLLIVTIGCGDALESARRSPSAEKPGLESATLNRSGSTAAETDANAVNADSAGVDRKIIYEATLSLVVEDFSKVEQAIPTLVRSHGGYLANANVMRNQGADRSGSWTARVPVDQFEPFLDAATDLGIPEQREQTGQDVTEEFVDLEARIASKKKLEQRILEILDSRDGEIKDVIEVERELSRVRTDIERMEGRLRYLQNRTSLTTVTIHAREQQNYIPPQAPGLGGKIAATWGSSIDALRATCVGLLLFAVAAAPWLVLLGVAFGPLWYWIRKYQQP